MQQDIEFMGRHQVVAVVRLDHPEMAPRVAERLVAGGVRVIEVTRTTPNAFEVIADLVERMGGAAREPASGPGGEVLIGAGTCTTVEDVREAVAAGARFVVSPCFFPAVVKATNDAGAVSIPGCLTPTEVLTAHRAGAGVIKLFPASIGGPGYLRTLRGLFPEVRLMPTGGVRLDNAVDFLQAGAGAVGIGQQLVKRQTDQEADLTELAARAATLMDAVGRLRRPEQERGEQVSR